MTIGYIKQAENETGLSRTTQAWHRDKSRAELTSVEHTTLDTFIQGNNSSVTPKASLSENQEDKLALLRTLQGILYTTRDESLTNLLSKYEWLQADTLCIYI
jgi:hypothetical protein